jgi:enamine deaminase RidA (YjgF/YER057c/UK114 family)
MKHFFGCRPYIVCPSWLFKARNSNRKSSNEGMVIMIKLVDPDGLMRNTTFSQLAISKGSTTVYTSGQVSIDEHGGIVGAGDLAAQTRQAMTNLRTALAAAGATFADVVKTTTFVVGMKSEQREIITTAKKPFWEGHRPPPSALIGVSALAQPEWLIEIEAVAVLE